MAFKERTRWTCLQEKQSTEKCSGRSLVSVRATKTWPLIRSDHSDYRSVCCQKAMEILCRTSWNVAGFLQTSPVQVARQSRRCRRCSHWEEVITHQSRIMKQSLDLSVMWVLTAVRQCLGGACWALAWCWDLSIVMMRENMLIVWYCMWW